MTTGATVCRGLITCLIVAGLMCVPTTAAGDGDAEPTLDELLNIAPADTTRRRSDRLPLVVPEGDDSASTRQRSLEELFDRMRNVSERLGGDLDPGLETQRVQESILAQLDQLIKAVKQSGSGGSSSSSGGSSGSTGQQDTGAAGNAPQEAGKAKGDGQKGGKPSGAATGSGAIGPTDQAPEQPEGTGPLRQSRVEWGNLPPRLRDEVLQSVDERPSAAYRRLTDAYFRRLAEENK